MKRALIICTALIISFLNINSYGELSEKQLEKAKKKAHTTSYSNLKKHVNCY